AAKWLHKPENMESFGMKFGAEAVIRVRQWTLKISGVPVSFVPSERAYRELERENGWKERDIIVAHWIKPPLRRKPNQRTAYLLVKVTSDEVANDAMMNGLLYRGMKLLPDRQRKEVRRCLKCQKFEPAHLAKDCTNKPACGTCGAEDHTTQDCSVPPGFGRFCVNCDEYGHASWERVCPAFIHMNRKIQAKDPFEKYRFFPRADDPRSWELL
ncbi:uncharacterized protein C8Q71DRAFT_688128, partial [Rhodofomes roseus]